MADNTRDLLFRFLGDARDLSNASSKAKSSLAGVDKTASKTKGSLSGTAGAAKAFGAAVLASGAVAFLGDAARAALEDQAAQTQLALALQNTVGATDEQVDAAESWIDTTARQTGVADDELRPALANLVRATDDITEAQDLMAVAMDIATAKGLPLETVVKGIAKAADGNVGALGRMGVTVKDAAGNTLSFEEALAEANRTMGGATAAAAGTAEGEVRKLAVAFDEGKESVGNFVIEGLGRVAEGAAILGTVGDGVAGMIERFEITTGAAADTAAAFFTIWKQGGVTFNELRAAMDLTAEELQKVRDADADFLHSLGLTDDVIAELRDNMATDLVTAARTARDRGIHPLREEIENTEDATRELIDANRALVDPLFALHDATSKARDAEIKYNAAVNEHGRLSREAVDAGLELADAQLDLNAASLTWAEDGGDASIQALRDTLTEAGLMPDAIQAIIDKFGVYNAAAAKITRIRFDDKGRPKIDPVVGKFAEGGVVPGAKGSPQLVLAHGGETILPTHKTNGHPVAAAGGNTYITVQGFIGNESQLAAEIDRMLTRRARTSGLGFQ